MNAIYSSLNEHVLCVLWPVVSEGRILRKVRIKPEQSCILKGVWRADVWDLTFICILMLNIIVGNASLLARATRLRNKP